jgi:hypothetical protein
LGLSIIFLSGIVLILTNKIADNNKETTRQEIYELATSIKMRLEVISTLHDGYSETLTLPYLISSKYYEINMTYDKSVLMLKSGDYSTSVLIPNVTGELKHGDNLIKKESDKITITQT